MKKINFKVITLFPQLIRSYLQDALLSKAITSKILNIEIINLREFSLNKYNSVDDTVFGGSDGMLFKYRPLADAMASLNESKKDQPDKKIVYLSPQGKPWNSSRAAEWAQLDQLVLICGRYAGVDQRFIHQFVDEEISIGDFVLSGGELGALAIIESISRFVPGVLGDKNSALRDSFQDNLLEAPQFTKPQIEDELAVPAVLLSGNHQHISEWQAQCSVLTTFKKRPDLLKNKNVDWPQVKKFYQQMPLEDKTVLGLLDLELPS